MEIPAEIGMTSITGKTTTPRPLACQAQICAFIDPTGKKSLDGMGGRAESPH
jgi:hypothetical protein